MKTNRKVTVIGRLTVLAVALGLLTTAATAVNAQEKAGTRLIQLNAPKTTAPVVASSSYTLKACASCKDSFVTIPDTDIQGAGARALVTGSPPTRTVASHLCGSCRNEWIIKGHGKAATSVPNHKCGSCG